MSVYDKKGLLEEALASPEIFLNSFKVEPERKSIWRLDWVDPKLLKFPKPSLLSSFFDKQKSTNYQLPQSLKLLHH